MSAHAGLIRDLIDHLLPQGRQLKTSARPLVDLTLMKQGDHHLLHLVNILGHSQTANGICNKTNFPRPFSVGS